jgi:hypothetical protein
MYKYHYYNATLNLWFCPGKYPLLLKCMVERRPLRLLFWWRMLSTPSWYKISVAFPPNWTWTFTRDTTATRISPKLDFTILPKLDFKGPMGPQRRPKLTVGNPAQTRLILTLWKKSTVNGRLVRRPDLCWPQTWQCSFFSHSSCWFLQ